MRTRIKICGITRTQDALAAADLGADAVGMVFFPPSPRNVTVAQAQAVAFALPPFVTAVALFVNPDAAFVETVIRQVPVQLLQFHGDETPEFCASFGLPFVKAVRMRPGVDLVESATRYSSARGLVVDAFSADWGGSGQVFDWSLIPPGISLPLILAGGLNPDNVGEAVAKVRPFAVDVSSGVENPATPKGIKDPARLAQFIAGVKHASL